MPTVEPKLRHLLDELSSAIKRSKNPDERAHLTRLRDDVERRLEEAGEEEHSGLIDSLEKAEIQFEAEHPTLAQSLRQAVQALSASGI